MKEVRVVQGSILGSGDPIFKKRGTDISESVFTKMERRPLLAEGKSYSTGPCTCPGSVRSWLAGVHSVFPRAWKRRERADPD